MEDRIPEEFAKLVEAIARLRGPGGCPWDREQTHLSLKKYAIEETYEVVEAIDSGDPAKLEDELGDFILQALLHAQIASESGQFDIGDVCRTIREKLIRRHPHVFADVEVSGVDDVLHNWEQIKRAEYEHRKSVLDGVPKSLPALMRAAKISKKAAKTGFDWPDVQAIIGKLKEETAELEEAVERADFDEIKDELGDLLFTLVNIARFQHIDPEEALRDMLVKFIYRFNKIEEKARQTGREISDMTLEEMDEVWESAKEQGTGSRE
ncbi:MAG: nucleoside triphosphate pyrophosphohydrolase [Armatimonadetes bacterium]|nr:nucleoside triphosphate pyrophosphohydrolase [Armatimonadota bacterium]